MVHGKLQAASEAELRPRAGRLTEASSLGAPPGVFESRYGFGLRRDWPSRYSRGYEYVYIARRL